MLLKVFFWIVPAIAMICYALLLVLFTISEKGKSIRAFIPVLMCLFIWSAASLLIHFQIYPGVMFWGKILAAAMCTAPLFFYCFTSVITGYCDKTELAAWGIGSVLILSFVFSGFVIEDVEVITSEITSAGAAANNIVDISYTLGWGAVIAYFYSIALLLASIKKARQAVSYGKAAGNLINPLIFGACLLLFGVFSNFIPQLGKYSIDLIMNFINSLLIIFVMWKNRSSEFRIIFLKGIIYSVTALGVSVFYIAAVLKAYQLLGNKNATANYNLFFMLIAALAFQPICVIAKKIVDKIFFNNIYTKRETIKDFSVSISDKLDLEEIANQLLETVRKAFNPRKAYFMLKNTNDTEYYSYKSLACLDRCDFTMLCDNPIVKWISRDSECLKIENIHCTAIFRALWETEKQALKDMDTEIIVPIKCRDELIGMLLLSERECKEEYTRDDLDFLASFGTSTAIAVNNARLYANAQKNALTDDLTGLYNHRYFHNALDRQMEMLSNSTVSVLMLDLDMFKLYNDLYGHIEGDRALRCVAKIMQGVLGNRGIAARYGGEEFAIFLPHHNSERAYDVAEKIREGVQSAFFAQTVTLRRFLTVSIGVSTYPNNAINKKELLKYADIALYKAKDNGKNQTVIYTPVMGETVEGKVSPRDDDEEGTNSRTTIYALTAAIDAKDHFTFGHSQKVAEYAKILSIELGMDDNHVEIIQEAALLHDIGKIGIPEYILTKPGRLTAEEYETIKKHVELSITIVKHLPSLNYVIPAIVGHHERWDGKGYPRGLKGENIPMGARCLAIADAFDAITSQRPYKPPLPIKVAVDELEDKMGTQFDPELAKVFIDLIKKGKIKV